MSKYWISLHDDPEFYSIDVEADSFEEAIDKGIYENNNELLEHYDEDESMEVFMTAAKEEYEYPLGKFENKGEAEKYKKEHNYGGAIRELKKDEEPRDLEGNIIPLQ